MNDDPAARAGADRFAASQPERAPPRRVAVSRLWTPGFTVSIGAVLLVLLVAFATIGRSYASHATPVVAEPPLARATIEAVAARGPSRNGIDYRRIDARLEALMRRRDMVGLGIAIVEDGQISFVKGYGRTQAGPGGRAVTPNTVFRWASISKGVAGTVAATLAAEKRLSLAAPVASFDTTLRLPGGGERTVTVAHLLSHRTGVVKNAYDDRLEGGGEPRVIRGQLGALSPFCRPASCFTYQNIAFDAFAEVVERVTGKPYAEHARFRLFLPLGMTSASMTRAGLQSAPSWARPHRGQRELPVVDSYYRVPAAGGVNSSVFDLGLWMRAQLGLAPAVLPRAVVADAQTARTRSSVSRYRGPVDRELKDPHYGLGWREYQYQGRRLVGHRGAVSGYRSLILFDPARRTGIAMLWNSESPKPVGMQLELFDMLYRLPQTDWMTLGNETSGASE